MRKLLTKDVFAFARCIKKIGANEVTKKAMDGAAEGGGAAEVGKEVIFSLLDAAIETSGEAVLYEFFAGPFEMEPGEVAELPLDQLMVMLSQLAKENDLSGFFSAAVKLMKSMR